MSAAPSDRPLRVLQVCPYDLARPGGVQSHVLGLSAALRRRGRHVAILAPRSPGAPPGDGGDGDPEGEALDGIPCFRLGRARSIAAQGTGYEVTGAFGRDRAALRTLMREGRWDLLHLHTPLTPFLGLQALASCASAAVATMHTTPVDGVWRGASERALRLGRRCLPRRVRAMIAVSEPGRAQLPPHRVSHVVPNGIDVASFLPAADQSVAAADLKAVCVGRLEPRKSVATLIDALRALDPSERPALTIVGDGPLRPALEARARGLAVTFVGAVNEAEKRRILRGAQILVGPASSGESFGIVLVEGMATGLAVVAAANPGYATVMTGPGGWGLFPPGDAPALADRLRVLVGDPNRRRAHAAWGSAEAVRYDWTHVAPRVESVYRDALRRHAGPR